MQARVAHSLWRQYPAMMQAQPACRDARAEYTVSDSGCYLCSATLNSIMAGSVAPQPK